MEVSVAVENRRPHETPMQRLLRAVQEFFSGLLRTALLAACLFPIIFMAFLTVDIPVKGYDHWFQSTALKPGNWLSTGGLLLNLAPMIVVLVARRFGGEEASRAVIAAWGLAAIAAFAEFTYLAPQLEGVEFPGLNFLIAFVAAAMSGQLFTAAVYDLTRGGGAWWRAPFYGLLSGYFLHVLLYYPIAYWTSKAPWPNWAVTDFAIKAVMASLFVALYYLLRKKIKPRGGFGG